MAQPRALILRAPGANCDLEAEFAFQQAGALAQRLHINRLREQPKLLAQYQILCVPGGFTYGDDVAAGKILAVQLQHFLGDALREFRDREKLILGICNGFQALLKAGLLMPPDEDGPVATLAHNERGKFVGSMTSRDDGRTWSEPVEEFAVTGETAHAIQVLLDRHGELQVFYLVITRGGRKLGVDYFLDLWVCKSTARRTRWSEPKMAYHGGVGALRGIVQTKSGRIVVPHDNGHGGD